MYLVLKVYTSDTQPAKFFEGRGFLWREAKNKIGAVDYLTTHIKMIAVKMMSVNFFFGGGVKNKFWASMPATPKLKVVEAVSGKEQYKGHL